MLFSHILNIFFTILRPTSCNLRPAFCTSQALTVSITIELLALCNQHDDVSQYITSAKLKKATSVVGLIKCIHLISPQGKISFKYKKM